MVTKRGETIVNTTLHPARKNNREHCPKPNMPVRLLEHLRSAVSIGITIAKALQEPQVYSPIRQGRPGSLKLPKAFTAIVTAEVRVYGHSTIEINVVLTVVASAA